VKSYNAGLKNGSSNKKYIHLGTTDSQRIDANALMSMAHESHRKLNRKKGPIADILLKIWHALYRYARVIDIFVQCDPQVSCLVWGSIRVLLKVGLTLYSMTRQLTFQMTEEEERASCIAAEGILEILRHVSRWEQATAISTALSSASVREAIVLLYTKVLGFLVSSTHWLNAGSLSTYSRRRRERLTDMHAPREGGNRCRERKGRQV